MADPLTVIGIAGTAVSLVADAMRLHHEVRAKVDSLRDAPDEIHRLRRLLPTYEHAVISLRGHPQDRPPVCPCGAGRAGKASAATRCSGSAPMPQPTPPPASSSSLQPRLRFWPAVPSPCQPCSGEPSGCSASSLPGPLAIPRTQDRQARWTWFCGCRLSPPRPRTRASSSPRSCFWGSAQAVQGDRWLISAWWSTTEGTGWPTQRRSGAVCAWRLRAGST